ncbi:MAG TPA: fumarylacetoacetate hydrolase family protein [Bellilinea sp.]|nr:fumarylacetoacetate hydrolase family protein [Bellilinea sp.]
MRFVRFQIGNGQPTFGWIYGEQIGLIDGTPFGDYRRLEAEIPFASVTLLPPTQPSKIICVGRNYIEHAKEHGNEVPDVPMLFLKPPSTLIGTRMPIQLPPQSEQVEHEAELAVVIGRHGRWISPNGAKDYVFGYTIANDVTARDLQRRDGQWTRGKGFDTFCPVGPWIETDMDPFDQLITCRVNQDVRQMASTRDMVFSVQQLIAFASSVMTLEPGDLILTGTPAGVGPLAPGDVVQISIEGIGELTNPVMAETPFP